MNVISRDEAVQKIRESNGTIFSVTFRKRTTNELRTMRCRTNVRAEVPGAGMKYDREEKKLLGAYLMAGDENRTDAKNWRSIPEEGIQSLKIGGETFTVAQPS